METDTIDLFDALDAAQLAEEAGEPLNPEQRAGLVESYRREFPNEILPTNVDEAYRRIITE